MIHDMRSGSGTVGKLLTDEQLYVELNKFVASAGDLTDGLKQGKGSLGKLLNDPATANALEASLTEHRDGHEADQRQARAASASSSRTIPSPGR